MRSQLTRNVCRRLLAQHALPPPRSALSSRCLHRYPLYAAAPIIRGPQRRAFLGVFNKPPREVKAPDLEPGYDTLLEFRGREVDTTRLPATEELVDGFRTFFRYKLRHGRSVNSTQAICALQLFRYLRTTLNEKGGLTLKDLYMARDALLKSPKGGAENHLQLSRELYTEIKGTQSSGLSNAEAASRGTAKELGSDDFAKYLLALTQYGEATEAAELLSNYWGKSPAVTHGTPGLKELWVMVLRGLAKEGEEDELLQRAREAEQSGVEYSPGFHRVMTSFYAGLDREEDTRKWFQKPVSGGQSADAEVYQDLFRFCLRAKRQPQWMKEAIKTLTDSRPSKVLWDVILQWAVLQGKSVEDIKRMMDVMSNLNEADNSVRPDIRTINGLIRAASEKSDPLLADRFISLASELGLKANATTHMLQLNYRIDSNDSSGAFSSFENLFVMDSAGEEALPVVNKYIRYLCAAQPPDVDRIVEITAIVDRSSTVLEPETVVDLCQLFLKNDQQYEVIDTLSLHVFHYSLEERTAVREAFMAYCLNRENSTRRVWDCYSLLRQFFPETDREDRLKLMDEFFQRKRPDMACYIFGHMRSHRSNAYDVNIDVYIRCLEGLGRCPDEENLKMVHNMLKMDTTIQPTTKLYNALMIAFAASDNSLRALEFWQDITNSIEGPSYNSLAIVFMVCQGLSYGDEKAREIWAKIKSMDIDVPQFVHTAYCGAIAAQANVDEVKELIQDVEADFGYPPHMMTLGVAYNALPGQGLQADFEEWAEDKYPDLWEKLRKRGIRKTEEGMKAFKISREMMA